MQQAVAHHQGGRFQEAERIYRQVLQHDPRNTNALQLLGLLAHAAGRNDVAVELIRKAIQIRPEPHFYVNLSQAYRGLGRLDDCLDACRRAVQMAPNIPEAWNNLGSALKDHHRIAEAIEAFRKAIALRPDYAVAHNNLGNALAQLAQLADAERSLRRAIELDPRHAGAQTNLGHLLTNLGRLDEAVEWCRRAVATDPKLVAAYTNLGTVLHRQGYTDEGDEVYRRAAALDPNNAVLHGNLLGAFNHASRGTPEESLAAHVEWARRFADVFPPPAGYANVPDPSRRLRIGYVSPDFKRHAVTSFFGPILANHDRQQFQVFAYSNVETPDAVTGQLRAGVDEWRDVFGLSDDALAERVRQDGIDILVDLAGHTKQNRLPVFGRRPAPVQVTYLGYPNTTGLRAIGYRITDAVCDPPGEPVRHTEELVRLPGGFSCYAPAETAPAVRAADVDGPVTFGSLHKASRLSDDVIDLWSELLLRTPGTRLLLLRHELYGETGGRVRRRFLQHGLDESHVRIAHVAPAGGHLAAYHEIDVSLDTFPWSGHTTACESMWMGVPVVTLYGDRHAGRMVSSVLTQLGLSDLIANSRSHYIEIASALAGDRERLAGLRAGLRGRMAASPLCDGAGRTRELEAAYRQMWVRWCGSTVELNLNELHFRHAQSLRSGV